MSERIDAQQAAHYLALAEQASQEIFGPHGPTWADRLEGEYDQLGAALQWFVEHGEVEEGLRMANALSPFWSSRRGYAGAGREWFAKFLALPSTNVDRATRGKALRFAGLLAFREGDTPAARTLNEEGLAIWQELGDKAGIATALADLARLALRTGEHEEVRRYAEESLAIQRELGNKPGNPAPLHLLAASARMLGDYQRAAQLYRETSALFREQGNDVGVAMEHFNMGYVNLRLGNSQLAAKHFEESIVFYRERNNESMVAASLAGLGGVAVAEGKSDRAPRLLGAAEAINRKLGVILDPDDRLEFERDATAARTSLGETKFGAIWAEGQAMSLVQAIAYALNED